jgi:SAM-dependent methyltransferase
MASSERCTSINGAICRCQACGDENYTVLFCAKSLVCVADEGSEETTTVSRFENTGPLQSYLQCKRCGFCWMADPSPSRNHKMSWTHPSQKRRDRARDEILFLKHMISPQSVLTEIGCGHGLALEAAKDLLHCGDVEGVETDPVLVESLRSRGIPCFHGTLKDRNYETASRDVVVSLRCLEHLPNIASEIREIHRVLKPAGLLYATDLPNLGRSIVGRAQGPLFYDLKESHFHFFTPQSLRGFLDAWGFDVIFLSTQVLPTYKEEYKNGRLSLFWYLFITFFKKGIEKLGYGEQITFIAQKRAQGGALVVSP